MNIQKFWENFHEKLSSYKIGNTNLEDILLKLAIFIGMLLIIPFLFSADKTEKNLDLKIGSIAPKKVIAPFNFYILKTEQELKRERNAAVQKVPFYFVLNDSLQQSSLKKLDAVLEFIQQRKNPLVLQDSVTAEVDSFYTTLHNELIERFNFSFTPGNLRILYDILSSENHVTQIKQVIGRAKKFITDGILSISLSEITRPQIVVLKNGIQEVLPPNKWRDVEVVSQSLENALLESFELNHTVILNYYFAQIVTPNLIFDADMTREAVERAIAGVATTRDIVYENERIVDANERIDAEIYQKLVSLHAAQIENSRREGNWQARIGYLARVMLLAAILMIGILYLYSYRRKIFASNKMLLMISIILLLEFIIASVISGPLNWHTFIIPTTIVSMLIAILIDSGIAFVATVVVALVIGGLQGGGYDLSLLTLVSGMVSIFSVHNLRRRNQLFRAILYIGLANLWVLVTLTALRFDPLIDAGKIYLYFMLPNAVMSPFVTFIALGVFEKLFDVTSDMTLLELSDLNHPLLKRLSMEAPGTFHHSMVVGNLAENAAKAIGANSLLARVGSYYHDVGKILKPEYFVENQRDAANRHNQLSANMSSLILSAHVKNGMELAEEYGIPKRIRDFIPEHHGTGIMKYFYDKAKKNADGGEINEADFRYPGPKPQSRETAIVMLCDSVEASTRTLQNPSPAKLRAFVENIVDQKFREGELDECDLALRDLKNIVDAFMTILYGVFQHRIEYPDQEKKKTAPTKKTKNDANGNSDSSKGPQNPDQ